VIQALLTPLRDRSLAECKPPSVLNMSCHHADCSTSDIIVQWPPMSDDKNIVRHQ
jgi:hypothetical protein